jgi:hypothetical protein
LLGFFKQKERDVEKKYPSQEGEYAATKICHRGEQEPIIKPYGVLLLWS